MDLAPFHGEAGVGNTNGSGTQKNAQASLSGQCLYALGLEERVRRCISDKAGEFKNIRLELHNVQWNYREVGSHEDPGTGVRRQWQALNKTPEKVDCLQKGKAGQWESVN